MALPNTPTWKDLIDELKRLFGEDASGFEPQDFYDALAFGCIMYLKSLGEPKAIAEETYTAGMTLPKLDRSVFVKNVSGRYRARYYSDPDWWQSEFDGTGLWIEGVNPIGLIPNYVVQYYKSGELFHSNSYGGRFDTTITNPAPYDREAQRIILDYASAYLQLLGPGEVEKLQALLEGLRDGRD